MAVRLVLLVLVEAAERVVVELPTNVAVAVQLLTVAIGQFETHLVGVAYAATRVV